jgi:stalled ribosome rescue protein Dom34
MNSAVFEIDRSKKGGQALYELLKNSVYAKLIEQKRSKIKKYEYTFDDLNKSTQEAFFDADMGKTYKSKDLDDLFNQLEI